MSLAALVTTNVTPIALDDGRTRVVIESITPAVDGGRFAAKRVLGDIVTVQADCFADGHDVVAARLEWRRRGEADWRSVPMLPLGNDRWQATFSADAVGAWEYAVRAWVDPFQSWQHDFERRVDADDLRVAALTGAELIAQAGQRAGDAPEAALLKAWSKALADAARNTTGDIDALKALGLSEEHAALARHHPDLTHALRSEHIYPLTVERARARCSAWYEFFPRSASDDAARHGTFADCEAWLPYVKRLGFDVLYFPPIHPIGRSRRKGKNNTLDAKPDDVGSPWAIGAAEGGHCAVLPELGTLDDFRRLVTKAAALEIDVAMDIAFQCAPDHPWVKEHPEWFRKRADGSIQYAENPPKKYQDIYPFDFESADWRAMWEALAGVFEFWIDQGVKVFRVDNPHTKAFPFWEWAIARVREKAPDVIFLSEAFTRPRVMHRLAKVGFSQSYTYYTWRNSKRELTDYFNELIRTPEADYFRPNVWPNTPDILPAALQYGGRPIFLSRVAMAATLSASYGIYGPAYELLVHAALKEGGEEYLDSEKFERRVWDLERPESIADFIAVLNQARRENPALHTNAGLRFLKIDNDQLLAYVKTTPDGSNTVVCVVNLDPHHTQSGWLELDLSAFGLEAGQSYQLHDVISGARYLWQGGRNYIALDPRRMPVHVMVLRTRMRRENDFDYFL